MSETGSAPSPNTAGPQAALAAFGEFALKARDLDAVLNEACRLVSEALGTELAKVIERRDDGHTLFIRAGTGWRPGIVGVLALPVEEDGGTTFALDQSVPVVSTDLAGEQRFVVPRFLVDHGVKALANVQIPGVAGRPPFGVLEVDSRRPRTFGEADTDFLRTYANLLGAAIERWRSLEELEWLLVEKERLLGELQHRVRNNLQTITSLVRMQQRRARGAEARRELLAVARRIETLNLVYAKLYATADVERVDLGTYLGELSATLLWLHADEAPGVRVRSDVQRLMVRLDRAVPLGLIVNEFVTNSFKYAFDGKGGLIGLEVQRHPDGTASLQLWDDGRGMAGERRAETGLVLIDAFVRQIGAQAVWAIDAGTRLTVTFEP
jgi:two-component sensor histidine kinase